MSLDALKTALAQANRILFRNGVVDAFGHISARHPDKPGHFLLARSIAPSTVTPDDIMEFDPDSEPVADARKPYLERFIHGEIYRVRPDVQSVVHSHSPSIIPFGVVGGVTLRPLFHMCGFLGAGAQLWDIRDARGDGTDMLVRDRGLGASLAASLGEASAVLMRGHGSTVVGGTVPQAVYAAVYAEVNARLQCQAITMGGPITFLSDAEAAAAAQTQRQSVSRAWDMWLAELAAEGAAR